MLQAAAMPVVVYNCASRRPLGTLPAGSGVSFYNMSGVSSGTKLARCDYAANGGDADKGCGTDYPSRSDIGFEWPVGAVLEQLLPRASVQRNLRTAFANQSRRHHSGYELS